MRLLTSFLRRFRRGKLGIAGIVLTGTVVLAGILSPLIAPFPSLDIDLSRSLLSPSADYLFGTDDLGKDIFSEILWGARTTLLVVAATVAASMLIGIVIGVVAGFWGGGVDAVLSRLIDGFLVVPQVILAIVVAAMLGPSRINMVLALTIVFWPTTARLVRAEIMSLRTREFVEAAQVAGLGRTRIAFGELLPLTTPVLLVNASFLASDTILAEAGLSFLGLNDPNVSSWGKMVFDSMGILRYAWWASLFPGIAIVMLVVGFNLIGDAATDALNPRKSKLGRVASWWK